MTPSPDAVRQRLVTPVAVCVMLGWLSSLVYAVISDNFTPLTVTTPVMLLLAGYTFGISITKRADKDE